MSTTTKLSQETFESCLSKYAKTVKGDDGKEKKLIILAVMDQDFNDIALNLYESSFKKFNIQNFLFVGVGKLACETVFRKNINCFSFSNSSVSSQNSKNKTKNFVKEAGFKTEIVLKVLNAGFSVLTMDVDHVFLQNPMLDIEKNLDKHDMRIMWDAKMYGTGFISVNPSNFTKNVYKEMMQKIVSSNIMYERQALNNILAGKKNLEPKKYKTRIDTLDLNKYLCGVYFFGYQTFPPFENNISNCEGCMVVQNNWINDKEAKRYRFKEALMWWVNEDGYYSSQETKYLSYANPRNSILPTSSTLYQLEIDALKSAFTIAKMLDRILILPRFHCSKNCFSIKKIDEHFLNKYRENSFFSHDLIPTNLKKFKTFYRSYSSNSSIIPKMFTLKTKSSSALMKKEDYKKSTTLDFSKVDDIGEESIIKTFAKISDSVIHFPSLLGVKVMFKDNTVERSFNQWIPKN